LFVGNEEERLVFTTVVTLSALAEVRNGERSTDRAAKLLLSRRRNLAESVLCRQTCRPIHIKAAAVKVIGAGLGYSIHNAAS